MNKNYKLGIIAMFFSLSSLAQKNDLHRLTGLPGTWKMTSDKGMIYEEWKKENDSTLKGRCYAVRAANDTVILEKMELFYRNGMTYYVPSVKKQNNGRPVYFSVSSVTEYGFIATNPEHDFPQNIIYLFSSPSILEAKVTGMVDGKYKEDIYNYIKQ